MNLLKLINEAQDEYCTLCPSDQPPTHLVLSRDYYEALNGYFNALAAKLWNEVNQPGFDPELRKGCVYRGDEDLLQYGGLIVLTTPMPITIVCCRLPDRTEPSYETKAETFLSE